MRNAPLHPGLSKKIQNLPFRIFHVSQNDMWEPKLFKTYPDFTPPQVHSFTFLAGTLLQLFPIFVIAFSKDCFHSSIVNSSLIDGVVFADIMFAVVETSEREREKTPNQTEN